ncbi:MAG: hypothetical protein ACYTDY_04000 [Planctomycetota bacterium]
MRRSVRTGLALTAVPALVLVVGLAWAAQSETIELPESPPFMITAVVVPGEDGGTVVASIKERTWDEKEDLDIDFDPEGELYAYGELVSACNLMHEHTVQAFFYETPEGWRCDVVVRDNAEDLILYSEAGHDCEDYGPDTCTATAEIVAVLTAE